MFFDAMDTTKDFLSPKNRKSNRSWGMKQHESDRFLINHTEKARRELSTFKINSSIIDEQTRYKKNLNSAVFRTSPVRANILTMSDKPPIPRIFDRNNHKSIYSEKLTTSKKFRKKKKRKKSLTNESFLEMSKNLKRRSNSSTSSFGSSQYVRRSSQKLPHEFPQGEKNANLAEMGLSPMKRLRAVAPAPIRVLDAPEILDDYYLNLLHWSAQSIVSVGLGENLYIWNSKTGDINQLFRCQDPDYISSVRFSSSGRLLAVGTSFNIVQLWDISKLKLIRTLKGHKARIPVLSWNQMTLSSGGRCGDIINHDVRVKKHIINTFSEHTMEVCGLSWNNDGKYLGSGANDNMVKIWQLPYNKAILEHGCHKGAVKAIGWVPWRDNVIATGGGSACKMMYFYNAKENKMERGVNTGSQVCALTFTDVRGREVVSSHGFSKNQVSLWEYSSMEKIVDLTGHTQRVLHMTVSPDKKIVVTAAGDETLRFWDLYTPSDVVSSKESKKRRFRRIQFNNIKNSQARSSLRRSSLYLEDDNERLEFVSKSKKGNRGNDDYSNMGNNFGSDNRKRYLSNPHNRLR